MLEQYWFQGL
jgi:hypothetical protein